MSHSDRTAHSRSSLTPALSSLVRVSLAVALASLVALTSCEPAARDAVLTADVPLHLERQLELAAIEGSDVPDDVPEPVAWDFAQAGNTGHAILGSGGKVGPDLAEVGKGRSFYALVADLWDHSPRMVESSGMA